MGVIPVSLDMVTAGDFDRMRRRHIKHLIILGASDDGCPARRRRAGILSEERRALAELGVPLDAGDAGSGASFRSSTTASACPRRR
ncbi:MAG: hypothetical protein ACLUEK_05450 [Oscillospiraceae bacterium]